MIVIHCSAVRPDQTSSATQINLWHRRDNHWKNGIGYHYVIRRDGTIEPGRPEWLIGAHCLNHNAHSIGICYEGGRPTIGPSKVTIPRSCPLAASTTTRSPVLMLWPLPFT